MNKKPRIGSLKSSRDNTQYIKQLKSLDACYAKYIQLKLCQAENKYSPKNLNTLINIQNSEIDKILTEIKTENPRDKDAQSLISEFSVMTENKQKKTYYQYANYHQKIKKTLSLEYAKQLFKLINTYNQTQKPEDKDNIDKYIEGKSDKELFGILNSVISKFKNTPNDNTLAETNLILGYFHKKIEKETYVSSIKSHNVLKNALTEYNERKVARADFNGGFYTPTYEDLGKHNPFSETYQKLTKHPSLKRTIKSDYDLETCPAWKTCLKSKNFAMLEPHFLRSLVELRIPPESLNSLNAVDIMDIMTPHEYAQDRNHKHFISYQSLEKLCDKGEKHIFLDLLNKKQLKNALNLVSIGHGKLKSKDVHHHNPIRSFGVRGNSGLYTIITCYMTQQEQKKQKNFYDYTDMHDFMHSADLVIRKNTNKQNNNDPEYYPVDLDRRHNGDTMYHMIDTRVAECKANNKILVLSGLREKDSTTIDLPSHHKNTNKHISKHKDGAEI